MGLKLAGILHQMRQAIFAVAPARAAEADVHSIIIAAGEKI